MPQSQQRLHRFMDLDFVVPPHVLRPRPETELLGARALTLLSELEAQLRTEGVESLSVPTDVSDPRALELLVNADMEH